MKICIINFSGRKNGNCAKIADFIKEEYKNEKVEIFHFYDSIISPCTKCEYECFYQQDCPYIEDDCMKLYEYILNSDLTYYIIPNYCDYPCANFFIFNERSQVVFQNKQKLLDRYSNINKKFIIVSNTNEDNFRQVLQYHTATNPDILFLSAKKYQKRSTAGDLIESEVVKKDIQQFIQYMFA